MVALAFRARLLRRGADDVGIKKMSDANEEKEPNNAKRGREVEKAVPTQQDVSVITERHQRQNHNIPDASSFLTSSSGEHSLASLLNLLRCVFRERKERERTMLFAYFREKIRFLPFF